MQRPFICHNPRIGSSPIIFNSPHSGRQYSRSFLSQSVLSFDKLRLSEDFYVDTLLEPAVDYGSILLQACFPRSFVDVNRSATELDQKLISNFKENLINPRTLAGLGVIPRVVGSGIEIYRAKISLNEVESRLKSCYFPYHQKLKEVISHSIASFGFAILFDFHSMPHSCINNSRNKRSLPPQVVLGDCFGTSCDSILGEKVFNIFSTAGFRVAMNNPFSGGFITKNYGMPKANVQAIQIEIDRSLYMNETDYTLHSGYSDLQKKLQTVIFELSSIKKCEKNVLQAAE
jgi:N-formylglutamate amidohydrolase